MLGAAQGRGRPSDRPPQEATPTPQCGEERAQGPGPPVEAGTSAASGAESRGGEGEVWGETPWLRSAPALASCSTERSRRRAVELRADRPGDGSVEGGPPPATRYFTRSIRPGCSEDPVLRAEGPRLARPWRRWRPHSPRSSVPSQPESSLAGRGLLRQCITFGGLSVHDQLASPTPNF